MTNKGRVTTPTDVGIDEQIQEVIKRWGVDAIRDCDGTNLSEDLESLNLKMYSTYLPTRNDQKWAKEHMYQLQHHHQYRFLYHLHRNNSHHCPYCFSEKQYQYL